MRLPTKADSFLKSSNIFYLFLLAVFFRILISGRVYPSSNYIFVVIFGVLILLDLPGKGRGLWLTRTEQVLLLVFFGALGLSVPLGIHPSNSAREMAVFFQYLLILLAAVRLTPADRIPAVLLTMILAGLISVAMGLRQYFGGFESTLAQVDEIEPYLLKALTERRIFGLTFSPDMLAGLLAMLIPLSLGLASAAVKSGQKIQRSTMILLSTPALLLLAGLILTRSVGGWLVGIFGIGIFFMLIPGKDWISSRAKIILASTSAVVLIVVAGWLVLTRGPQFTDFSSWDNPVLLRALNWKASTMVYKEKPLFGVGLGNLGLAYPKHRPLKGNEIKYVHNNYLQILVETGPLGLLGLVGLAGLFLALTLKKSKSREPGSDLITKGIFAAGAAFLAHSMIDFDLYTPEVGSVFFLILALLIVGNQTPDTELAGNRKILRVLFAVALLAFMAGSLYLFDADRELKKAQEMIQEGKHSEAEDLLRRHLKRHNRSDRAHAALARALRTGQGPGEEVIQQYRLAQALNPHYSYYYQELGDYLFEQNWLKAAEGEYRRAIELYPNNYSFNLGLGLLLLRQNKHPEAEAVLKHATECTWNNYDAWLNLAQLYIEQDRMEEAEKILKRLTVKFPQNQPAWILLRQIYDMHGNKDSHTR